MITLGPSLTGLRGTQVMGSIMYTLQQVSFYQIGIQQVAERVRILGKHQKKFLRR
jgi:hypothetical protein